MHKRHIQKNTAALLAAAGLILGSIPVSAQESSAIRERLRRQTAGRAETESEVLTEASSEEDLPEAVSETASEDLTESLSEAETETDTESLTEEASEPEEDLSESERLSEEELPEENISESVSEALWPEGDTEETTESEALRPERDPDFAMVDPKDRVPYPVTTAQKLALPLFDRLLTDLPVPETRLWALGTMLQEQFAEYDGIWSAAVIDLTTYEQILVGEESMRSASVMKLFILGAVYDAIGSGDLTRSDELVSLMSSMIKASSNTAANELIRRLGDGDFARGVDAVNAYIQAEGYHEETHLYNGFQDDSLHLDEDHENTVCPEDAAAFLEKVYSRTLARRAVCNEIEEWMLAQETRYKIPKGVPDGVLVGNKTGETDSIENDCAVIYTPFGDYILCVFSNNWESKELAQMRITEVSETAYAYFSDQLTCLAGAMRLPLDYFEDSL